jgi:genome maintenance exonuclease 1
MPRVGPFDLDTFNSLRPLLDKIDNVYCLETQLYSDHLQVAGTVDCIAEYEGRLSIIDFKTSKRVKTRDDIHSYFMQTAAYAVMFEERTGIPVDTLVILMSVDDEQPIVFKEKRDDWIGTFVELREDYSKLMNA